MYQYVPFTPVTIASDNGFSSVPNQAITWTIVD